MRVCRSRQAALRHPSPTPQHHSTAVTDHRIWILLFFIFTCPASSEEARGHSREIRTALLHYLHQISPSITTLPRPALPLSAPLHGQSCCMRAEGRVWSCLDSDMIMHCARNLLHHLHLLLACLGNTDASSPLLFSQKRISSSPDSPPITSSSLLNHNTRPPGRSSKICISALIFSIKRRCSSARHPRSP